MGWTTTNCTTMRNGKKISTGQHWFNTLSQDRTHNLKVTLYKIFIMKTTVNYKQCLNLLIYTAKLIPLLIIDLLIGMIKIVTFPAWCLHELF